MELYVIYAVDNSGNGHAFLHSAYTDLIQANEQWVELSKTEDDFSYYMEPINLIGG